MIIFDRIVSSIRGPGGIHVLFDEITTRLARDGIEYKEFGYERADAGRNNFFAAPKRTLERFRPAEVPLQLITGVSDIFHSTYYRVPAKSTSLKCVTTVHDFVYERKIGGLRTAVHSWQKRHAIKTADHIICVSNNTREDLFSLIPNIDERKVSVIHNGVSECFYPCPSSPIQSYVLFVGERGGYKNFDSVVFALSRFPDLQLKCVGGGPFTSREVHFMNIHIPNRFEHLGYISSFRLNEIYNSAYCLIYPSLYEGFGIPVLEAMRAGCPVIAVNCSSIPEVAGAAAVLLETGSPGEISEAISFLGKPNVRNILTASGFEWSKNFSWERCFAETVRVYEMMNGFA